MLWELATGKKLGEIKGRKEGDRDFAYLAFSPDGKALFVGQEGIKVWNIADLLEYRGWK
jgi:hypothetical protein